MEIRYIAKKRVWADRFPALSTSPCKSLSHWPPRELISTSILCGLNELYPVPTVILLSIVIFGLGHIQPLEGLGSRNHQPLWRSDHGRKVYSSHFARVSSHYCFPHSSLCISSQVPIGDGDPVQCPIHQNRLIPLTVPPLHILHCISSSPISVHLFIAYITPSSSFLVCESLPVDNHSMVHWEEQVRLSFLLQYHKYKLLLTSSFLQQVHYLMCLAANYAHIKDQEKFMDLQEIQFLHESEMSTLPKDRF